MAKRFTPARRLSAVVVGSKAPGAIESHERNVLAITRHIHTLARKQLALKKQLAEIREQLKARRRELRAVLQRDSSITTDDRRLDAAGQSDAIDAAEHRRERD